jgi:hypothetical protein
MADENDAPVTSPYEVDINGLPHTLMLTEEGAEAYGDRAKKKGSTPSTKAKTPANKSASTANKKG